MKTPEWSSESSETKIRSNGRRELQSIEGIRKKKWPIKPLSSVLFLSSFLLGGGMGREKREEREREREREYRAIDHHWFYYQPIRSHHLVLSQRSKAYRTLHFTMAPPINGQNGPKKTFIFIMVEFFKSKQKLSICNNTKMQRFQHSKITASPK